MNVQVLEESDTRRVLDIELSPEEIREELERVVDDYSRKISLPGFRKGHVPRSMLEARFGTSFEQETLERSIERACREAFTERGIAPLLPAEIEDLKFTPGGPLRFKALAEVRPPVEAKDYKGLSVTRKTREINDEDVEREVDALVASTTLWLDVERPSQSGDQVVVDHVRLDAKGQVLKSSRRRDVEIELGQEGLLPAFEEGLAGVSAGDSRTLRVDYPDDFANQELAGRSVQFHVKVKKIKEKKVREKDDNWAREALGVDTLDELRARIRLNLEGEAKFDARRQAEEALVEAVVERNPVPVPERWAERRVAEELADLEKRAGQAVPEAEADTLKQRIRSSLERQVRREFLLEAIARQESLSVSDGEVGDETTRLLKAGGRIAQEFRALPSEQRRDRVRDILERRKVFDFLLDHAQVTEEIASNSSNRVVPG